MEFSMRRATFLLLLLVPLAACGSPGGPARESLDPLAPRPWTTAFIGEAVLVADEIRIEGPEDLLTHVAVRQDPDEVEYDTQTVPEGLLQDLRVRPGIPGDVRAQLDGWALSATRRMVILQRPGEVPVVVRARGNVLFVRADGTGEQRADELSFRGLRGE
jgi:hypothetical protein